MQASSFRYCVTTFLPTPPGYTKKQPQPRLFLYTEGEESVRLNKNAHCFAVEPSRLSATCRRHTSRRRHIAFAKGKNIASSLLRALYFCFFAKEKPSEIRTVFCCLDLLFFVEQCFVDIIVFCWTVLWLRKLTRQTFSSSQQTRILQTRLYVVDMLH